MGEFSPIPEEAANFKAPETATEDERLGPICQKLAPRLVDLAADNLPRENEIRSKEPFSNEEQNFREREGLTELLDFLDQIIVLAEEKGNFEILNQAKAFRENLAFVGQNEFSEATSAMATRILASAEEGREVYLFHFGSRSQEYVTLKVLSEIDRLVAMNSEAASKIHLSNNPFQVAERAGSDNGQVYVIDDFAISGTRIKGFLSTILKEFIAKDVPPAQALEQIEGMLVARPIRESSDNLYRAEGGQPFKTYSYYGVKEYFNPQGSHYVFGGISLTGSHCSTDYGFETPLEEFGKFSAENGVKLKPPKLAYISRPYEKDRAGHFLDLNLEAESKRLRSQYELKREGTV